MLLKKLLYPLLLFCSGLCALIYQVSWMRAFRAVFGVSTQASAAVMAVFMAGLGLGAYLLGPRVDRGTRPLRTYGLLELGITLCAVLSPLLTALGGKLYVALGGMESLGHAGALPVRLLIAVVVLGPATFLMGGTLPAMTRALHHDDDPHRAGVGLLYGANTLGAFAGGLAAAFYCHEHLGVQRTLYLTAALNLVPACAAFYLGRKAPPAGAPAAPAQPPRAAGAPRTFVWAAVTLSGLLFLAMELVWYRMLGPLLGGSTYTMSLILCGALAGIGLGGLLYGRWWRFMAPTLGQVAWLLGLQAVLTAAPFAAGDHLAVWVAGLGGPSFGAMVWGWTKVVALVVVPVSVPAGMLFPLLIALLGRGRDAVGRQIGQAGLFNSAGAALGALAGGFGLMPLLGAGGVWRVAAIGTALTGIWALLLALRAGRRDRGLAGAGVLLTLGLLLACANGPGAPWKHSGIGVGRSGLPRNAPPNMVRDWLNVNRRQIIWSRDGVESTVGISNLDGYAFIVNGKTDGNAVGDAGTQVMSGLIGAALHPEPRRALVVGLGTGSTAGMLGQVPGMERVDVVELEEAVLHMAALCAPVNGDVMHNARVHTVIGDAREYLLTTANRYDLIVSEPSNPYRAGISSMYTRAYYRDVAARLNPGGLFLQWLQGYSVDRTTIERVYSTLAGQFAHVETWVSGNRDMILVAGDQVPAYDAARLRAVLEGPPFADAMAGAWRTTGLEGFLSRYYADASFTAEMAVFPPAAHNSDDRPFIEFAMARSIAGGPFNPYHAWNDLQPSQRRPVLDDPEAVDWDLVDENRINLLPEGLPVHRAWFADDSARATTFGRMEGLMQYYALERDNAQYPHRLEAAMKAWGGPNVAPRTADGRLLVGEWAATLGHPEVLRSLLAAPGPLRPAEGAVLRAMALANGGAPGAGEALAEAFSGHQIDPWPRREVMEAALMLTPWVAARDAAAATHLSALLQEPFAVSSLNAKRRAVLVLLAEIRGYDQTCVRAFAPLEPHIPWDASFLERRMRCYEAVGDARADAAKADLEQYRRKMLDDF